MPEVSQLLVRMGAKSTAVRALLEASASASAASPPPPPPASQGKGQGKGQGKSQGKSKGKGKGKTLKAGAAMALPAGFDAAPHSKDAAEGRLAGRELQAWQPDNETGLSEELDQGEKWDQFETNERKFGVKSTFDENLYTTRLEKGKVTKEQAAEAERIAREIMSGTTDNAHVAEEREQEDGPRGGGHADDGDEESRYGAVMGTGAYTNGVAARQGGDGDADGFTDAAVLKGGPKAKSKGKRKGKK